MFDTVQRSLERKCNINFLLTATVASCRRRVVFFVRSQRDNITTADDRDHAHFFICQILGALKKGHGFNQPWPPFGPD